jgi:hypothetical protein
MSVPRWPHSATSASSSSYEKRRSCGLFHAQHRDEPLRGQDRHRELAVRRDEARERDLGLQPLGRDAFGSAARP